MAYPKNSLVYINKEGLDSPLRYAVVTQSAKDKLVCQPLLDNECQSLVVEEKDCQLVFSPRRKDD
ncbi:MAG: hypothetical protein GOVbin4162_138 [Prokaryotic dsDNA virus sp.]|nr:MAG: hypothetical protein GOVbin4162_138 [Prokaryotic dsDNA virus sp.]|tara:strand:- start:3196 stop:3390 length:195 start_codon:yes stop_codon:yes gene_type:complete